MNDITIDISNLNFKDPEIAGKIEYACKYKFCFVLIRKKSFVVFDPVNLCSRCESKTTFIQQEFQYNDMEAFIKAVQIQLVTHRNVQLVIPPNTPLPILTFKQLPENKS